MTDWEKYAIIGTALASGYLILKPKAKPAEVRYPAYEPYPPTITPYVPMYKKPEIDYKLPPREEYAPPEPPKLMSTAEKTVLRDIDALEEQKKLLQRLRSLQYKKNLVKDEIIKMTMFPSNESILYSEITDEWTPKDYEPEPWNIPEQEQEQEQWKVY